LGASGAGPVTQPRFPHRPHPHRGERRHKPLLHRRRREPAQPACDWATGL